MGVRGWRGYYADGGTIDSTEAPALDLPDGLVGVVVYLEPPYRRIVDGGDWYWVEDGRWRASETVWDGWVERPRPDAIRSAPALADEDWAAMREVMLADREWPDGD